MGALTAKLAKGAERVAARSHFRHPPLERSGMRGTHEHSRSTVIMGGPNKTVCP
jgi:hypothetical protein